MLTKYATALTEGGVKDSTIINHLSYIHKWATYVDSYENIPISKGFFAANKSMQKGLRKQRNRAQKIREIENDEQQMIESGCWPEGGIQRLRDEVIRSVLSLCLTSIFL